MHRFKEAVDKAVLASEIKESIKYNLEIISSREMPEFSIIDYLIWAVQRKILQGESLYFDALKSKYASESKCLIKTSPHLPSTPY